MIRGITILRVSSRAHLCAVALAWASWSWSNSMSSVALAQDKSIVERITPAQAEEHANALSVAFRNSAEKILPAVVAIRNEVPQRPMRRRTPDRQLPSDKGFGSDLPPEFGEFEQFFKRFFDNVPGTQFDVPERPYRNAGSGVIIESSGVVLTNAHVVSGNGKITVSLQDGREFVAENVLTDPHSDIAVVRIQVQGEQLPQAKFGNSDAVQIGDWVIAVGQPFGLRGSVTAGIISAKDRNIDISDREEFLQTDAAINPGNSGGPLVNLKGEIVGISTAITSASGGFQGVGFAIPANEAKWVSDQLLHHSKVQRAYLGVGIQAVTPELGAHLGLERPIGALVTNVQPDSPAASAGIKPQDVIVAIDAHPVSNLSTLHSLVSRSEIGVPKHITVVRDGTRLELKIVLRMAPEHNGESHSSKENEQNNDVTPSDFDKLGLQVGPLSDPVAKKLGIADAQGVMILAVQEGSAAELAGLKASMVIRQLGRSLVHNQAEYAAALKSASLSNGVIVLIVDTHGSGFVLLKAQ